MIGPQAVEERSMPPSPRVAIILVSWNTRDLLRVALSSIRQHAGQPVRVIVVDNASSDGSPDMVRIDLPGARLVVNTENRGFGQANNQGFAVADEPYTLLLNSDAELTPGALPALIDDLERHPEAGAVGARLVFPDGRFQAAWYRFPTLWTYGLELAAVSRGVYGREYPSVADVPTPGSVPADWVSGACMLVRREAIMAIGGFDPDYHLYSEEMDLCRRMWRAGWSVRYCPTAVAVHHVGQSARQRAIEQPRLLWESRLTYFRKHHTAAHTAALYAMIQAAYAGRWIVWSARALTASGPTRQHWRLRARAASTLVRELRMPSAGPNPSPPTARGRSSIDELPL